jgi:hypothetical protein
MDHWGEPGVLTGLLSYRAGCPQTWGHWGRTTKAHKQQGLVCSTSDPAKLHQLTLLWLEKGAPPLFAEELTTSISWGCVREILSQARSVSTFSTYMASLSVQGLMEMLPWLSHKGVYKNLEGNLKQLWPSDKARFVWIFMMERAGMERRTVCGRVLPTACQMFCGLCTSWVHRPCSDLQTLFYLPWWWQASFCP